MRRFRLDYTDLTEYASANTSRSGAQYGFHFSPCVHQFSRVCDELSNFHSGSLSRCEEAWLCNGLSVFARVVRCFTSGSKAKQCLPVEVGRGPVSGLYGSRAVTGVLYNNR